MTPEEEKKIFLDVFNPAESDYQYYMRRRKELKEKESEFERKNDLTKEQE